MQNFLFKYKRMLFQESTNLAQVNFARDTKIIRPLRLKQNLLAPRAILLPQEMCFLRA